MWRLPLHANSQSTSFADCARTRYMHIATALQLYVRHSTEERGYSCIYDGTLQQESQTNFTLHCTLQEKTPCSSQSK